MNAQTVAGGIIKINVTTSTQEGPTITVML